MYFRPGFSSDVDVPRDQWAPRGRLTVTAHIVPENRGRFRVLRTGRLDRPTLRVNVTLRPKGQTERVIDPFTFREVS